jgi:hypothetical protein
MPGDHLATDADSIFPLLSFIVLSYFLEFGFTISFIFLTKLLLLIKLKFPKFSNVEILFFGHTDQVIRSLRIEKHQYITLDYQKISVKFNLKF